MKEKTLKKKKEDVREGTASLMHPCARRKGTVAETQG